MATVTLTPAQLVIGGDALARDSSGRVVFVAGALPGETVRVRLRAEKKDFAKGDVCEVLAPSADRVVPPCDAFRRGCGGCDWQHIEAAAQLRFKVGMVAEALRRTGGIREPVVEAGGQVPPWSYRTTIRVAFDQSGVAGFRSRRSHAIVPVTSCPVAHPAVNALLAGAVAEPGAERVLRAGLVTGETSGGPAGAVHEDVAGHRFRVSDESFFQSSPAAAELLVDAVGQMVAGVDIEQATVVDAYGGVGLFAATVATAARQVVLIEASASSAADARHNLAGRNVTIEHTLVEEWTPVAADLVIADPARTGLGRAAVSVLAATGAGVIVLVSCDGAALARDARLLGEAGYRHERTVVIDVFPQTSHIEAVTRFRREMT